MNDYIKEVRELKESIKNDNIATKEEVEIFIKRLCDTIQPKLKEYDKINKELNLEYYNGFQSFTVFNSLCVYTHNNYSSFYFSYSLGDNGNPSSKHQINICKVDSNNLGIRNLNDENIRILKQILKLIELKGVELACQDIVDKVDYQFNKKYQEYIKALKSQLK